MATPKSKNTTEKIQKQIIHSLDETLVTLHIQTKSKKVKKLVEKASKMIAKKVMKELKKQEKAKGKASKKANSLEKKQTLL
jgi:hypothetical protein